VTGFAPQAADWEARVRDSFARQGIMATLGATLTRVEPGAVEIAVDHRPGLTQQHGYFHAGVTATIADSAGGYAGFSLMPGDASVLTVEYKLNLLAPADGRRLVARGRVIRPGRTLVVTRVDVAVERDGAEHACATMLQTLMTMHGRADAPSG
jgi:uncharacterized protein (TIGR00369 family)